MKYILFIVISLLLHNVSLAQDFDYQTDFDRLVTESKAADSLYNYEKLKAEFIANGEDFTEEQVVALVIGQFTSESYYSTQGLDLERQFRSFQRPDDIPLEHIYVNIQSMLEIPLADPFSEYYVQKAYEKGDDRIIKDLLELNPVNLSLNYGLWKIYEEKKDFINAKRFKSRFELISKALLSTGKGTLERPYFVMTSIDADVIIKYYYNHQIGEKDFLMNSNEQVIEIVERLDGDKSVPMHFITDHSWILYNKLIEEEGKKYIDRNAK